jgi:molybdopterin converting factor small subunit
MGFLSILSDKIENAKEIVEAGKNISALKEAKESLEKELAQTRSDHQEAMKAVEVATNEEIESLKRTIAA